MISTDIPGAVTPGSTRSRVMVEDLDRDEVRGAFRDSGSRPE